MIDPISSWLHWAIHMACAGALWVTIVLWLLNQARVVVLLYKIRSLVAQSPKPNSHEYCSCNHQNKRSGIKQAENLVGQANKQVVWARLKRLIQCLVDSFSDDGLKDIAQDKAKQTNVEEHTPYLMVPNNQAAIPSASQEVKHDGQESQGIPTDGTADKAESTESGEHGQS